MIAHLSYIWESNSNSAINICGISRKKLCIKNCLLLWECLWNPNLIGCIDKIDFHLMIIILAWKIIVSITTAAAVIHQFLAGWL